MYVTAIACALVSLGAAYAEVPRDLRSDTWVATDALGRSSPRRGRGRSASGEEIRRRLLFPVARPGRRPGRSTSRRSLPKTRPRSRSPQARSGDARLAPHHWGESIFGYYISDDESVLRKHAQMLTDAGVDMIVFDVTNQVTYPQNWKALCRVFDQSSARETGCRRSPSSARSATRRRSSGNSGTIFTVSNLYPDLWFRWEGKPLILADPGQFGADYRARQASPGRVDSRSYPGADLHGGSSVRRCRRRATHLGKSDSAVTLSLYRRGAEPRSSLASRRFDQGAGQCLADARTGRRAAPGTYELEMSGPEASGLVEPPDATVRRRVRPLPMAAIVAGERTIRIATLDDGTSEKIRRFFTFRKPQPDYFKGPTGPEQWGWLEVYPQHAFYKMPGVPEEVAVGVAQNAAEGKLSVFTYPRSHGRSFHDGQEPGPTVATLRGATSTNNGAVPLEIDPAFHFRHELE